MLRAANDRARSQFNERSVPHDGSRFSSRFPLSLLRRLLFERSQLITAASLEPFARLAFQPNLLILMGPKRLSIGALRESRGLC